MTESTEPTRTSDEEWDRLKSSSTAVPQTESEQLFAQYLDQQQYDWCFEPTFASKSKIPDFVIRIGERLYVFEVKERLRIRSGPSPQWVGPMQWTRKEIEKARCKFKEFKKFPCSLVIFNPGDLDTVLDPERVFGAMLGDPGITMAFDDMQGRLLPETAREVFTHPRGKMRGYNTREYHNTRISAIIVLQKGHVESPEFRRLFDAATIRKQESIGRELHADEQDALRWDVRQQNGCCPMHDQVPLVVVCEHPDPKVLLSQDMFTGPYDERYVYVDGILEQTYVGRSIRRLVAVDG